MHIHWENKDHRIQFPKLPMFSCFSLYEGGSILVKTGEDSAIILGEEKAKPCKMNEDDMIYPVEITAIWVRKALYAELMENSITYFMRENKIGDDCGEI